LGTLGAIAQLGERLLCKQEVTGSIPVGSIAGIACKSWGLARQVVLDRYSVLAESTAGEYHIGPYFAGDRRRVGLQAGGRWFDPRWWTEPEANRTKILVLLARLCQSLLGTLGSPETRSRLGRLAKKLADVRASGESRPRRVAGR
jgi:hypothetical protein